MTSKQLVIMRGLPCCGKSYTAKEIIEKNPEGVIFSTDDYWYEVVKPDQPDTYNYIPRYVGIAHDWNQQRAFRAIEAGQTPILIDNTNVCFDEFRPYVEYSLPQDYEVILQEPTSETWLENSPYLKDTRRFKRELKRWAKDLEECSKGLHDVPYWAIERKMWRWESAEEIQRKIEELQ